MVRKISKQLLVLLLPAVLSALVSLSGCGDRLYVDEESCDNWDYRDCNTIEPTHADVIVKLTINELNPSVPFYVFAGYYENRDTMLRLDLSSLTSTLRLPVARYYSVLAVYKTPNGLVKALDGGNTGKKRQAVCDSVCWWEKELRLDLRLLP